MCCRGSASQRLADAILAAHNNPELSSQHTEEYAYYPRQWVSPYIDRRRKVGWGPVRAAGPDA